VSLTGIRQTEREEKRREKKKLKKIPGQIQ
jgi:hypothetical protein